MSYRLTVNSNKLSVSLSRTGGQGTAGVSIVGGSVNESNELVFTLSDGSTINAGVITITSASTNIEGLANVEITNLADGQVLSYDSATSTWVNTLIEGLSTPSLSEVTAVGSTTNDSITVGGLVTDSLTFAGGNTLTWNSTDNTVDIPVSDDVTLQVGQEFIKQVTNQSGRLLTNGDVVRVTGSQGQRLTVDWASADSPDCYCATFGVVTEDIPNNGEGFVTLIGMVRDLDTSGYSEGDTLWLGADGGYVNSPPVSPNFLVKVGWVINSNQNNGSIYVSINNSWSVPALNDVTVSNLTDGQLLQWDNTEEVWTNVSTSSLGFQPLDSVLTNTTASYTTEEQSKLATIEPGATADQSPSEILSAVLSLDGSGSGLDADLLDGRDSTDFADAVHGHSIDDVTGLQTTLDLKLNTSSRGAANGVASLDSSGKVPSVQLPSFVDDVLEYSTASGFPATGATGKLYVALDSNDVYRWSGSSYIKVSDAVSTADQATKLATARAIRLTGDVSGLANFDGTAEASIVTTVVNNSHTHTISNITDFTDNSTNWDTAYSWGDHASAGYLDNSSSIKSLSDVNSSMTPSDGQALVYDSTNGWQAETLSAGGGAANLTDLNDVYTAMSPSDGQVLTYDSTNGWQAEDVAASINSLGDVADVTITTVAAEDLLQWDGSAWVNRDAADAGLAAAVHTHTISDITDFTDNSTNWDTAYSWGDHSLEGYLTSESDPVFNASEAASITSTDTTNWDTAYSWGDHSSAGYLSGSDIGVTVQAYDSDLDTWSTKTAPIGDVVGTSDNQTLTNKTLTTPAISNPTLTGTIVEDVYAVTGTTPALDPANGSIQTWTLTANSTPSESISAGEAITLMIDDGSGFFVDWATSMSVTWVNNAGSAPTLATTGYTVIALWKVSTTLYGALVGDGS